MRLLLINGSPSGAESTTHMLAAMFIAGAREMGAAADNLLLAEYDIRPCLGCGECWQEDIAFCRQPDDMRLLLAKVRQADVLIFATPVHFENVTGLLKVFMDRMVPFISPCVEPGPGGDYQPVPAATSAPAIAVIATCDMPDQSHFEVLRLFFRRLAGHLNTTLVAEIYRSQAELLRGDSLVLRPFIAPYLKHVRQAGAELAREGCLSQKTRAALDHALVPPGLYAHGANVYWNKRRGEED